MKLNENGGSNSLLKILKLEILQSAPNNPQSELTEPDKWKVPYICSASDGKSQFSLVSLYDFILKVKKQQRKICAQNVLLFLYWTSSSIFIYLFTNLENGDTHNNTWIKHDKAWIRHHCYPSGDKIIFSKILFSLVKSAVRYITRSTIPSPFRVILTFVLHAFAYSASQTKRTNDMS